MDHGDWREYAAWVARYGKQLDYKNFNHKLWIWIFIWSTSLRQLNRILTVSNKCSRDHYDLQVVPVTLLWVCYPQCTDTVYPYIQVYITILWIFSTDSGSREQSSTRSTCDMVKLKWYHIGKSQVPQYLISLGTLAWVKKKKGFLTNLLT